jgi:hypothetical protein
LIRPKIRFGRAAEKIPKKKQKKRQTIARTFAFCHKPYVKRKQRAADAVLNAKNKKETKMKKNLFAFAAACLIAAFGAGASQAQAQDLKENATQAEIDAFEAENFVDFDSLDSSSDAKFAASLIAANGEGAEGSDAKCWFWGWRYYTYSYPSYYYYTWYCPAYYVNFRLVYYTVPTTTVVTAPAVTSTTTTTTVSPSVSTVTTTNGAATAVAIAKSSGQTACGAVIDQAVPANSPLAKLGLQVGDVVTSVDGAPVKSIVDLRKITVDSKLTFVPGSQISVSKKAVNHAPSATAAKTLSKSAPMSVSEHQKAFGDKETISLYEYYEALEK